MCGPDAAVGRSVAVRRQAEQIGNRGEEQPARQNAGKLRRQIGEPQPVLQDDDSGHAQQRAADRSAAAGDRRAAEHDGRNRHQLVSGARVCLGLAGARDVQERRAPGDESREHVEQRQPATDRDTRVPRAVGEQPIAYQLRP